MGIGHKIKDIWNYQSYSLGSFGYSSCSFELPESNECAALVMMGNGLGSLSDYSQVKWLNLTSASVVAREAKQWILRDCQWAFLMTWEHT